MHHNAGHHLRTRQPILGHDSTSDSDSFVAQTTASYSEDLQRQETDDSQSETDDSQAESDDAQSESESDDLPVSELDLTRRQNGFGFLSAPTSDGNEEDASHGRDVAAEQKLYQSHCAAAGKIFPKSVWRIMNTVKYLPKTTQTAVLQACKIMLPSCDRKVWPSNRKYIDAKLQKRLGSFHPRVTRTIKIDLSHHKLPGLATPFTFSFIDPLFAWANCAYRLSKSHRLYFQHRALVHPTSGERLYGASVQNGDIMREACQTRPGAPAIIGISWDAGLASRRRSYTPVLISVGNTDYSGKDVCVCIGYMPDLNLGAYSKKAEAKEAMHELRQAVIGAVVRVIEESAQTGFRCLLSTESG